MWPTIENQVVAVRNPPSSHSFPPFFFSGCLSYYLVPNSFLYGIWGSVITIRMKTGTPRYPAFRADAHCHNPQEIVTKSLRSAFLIVNRTRKNHNRSTPGFRVVCWSGSSALPPYYTKLSYSSDSTTSTSATSLVLLKTFPRTTKLPSYLH